MFAKFAGKSSRYTFNSVEVHCVSGQPVIKLVYQDYPLDTREIHLTQQEASKLANLLKEAIAGNTLVGSVI